MKPAPSGRRTSWLDTFPARSASGREPSCEEYTPLRLATSDLDTLAANFRRSEEIHLELWSIVEELVRTTQNTDITALFVEAVDQIVEVHEARAIAGLHSRVPETVVFLLLGGSTLTLLLVGYSAGITERRSLISAVALVVALSVVTVLVLDIDRPRDGIVQVSQQPLLDLERRHLPADCPTIPASGVANRPIGVMPGLQTLPIVAFVRKRPVAGCSRGTALCGLGMRCRDIRVQCSPGAETMEVEMLGHGRRMRRVRGREPRDRNGDDVADDTTVIAQRAPPASIPVVATP